MHRRSSIPRISTNMNNDAETYNRLFRSVIFRVENFEIKRSHRRSLAHGSIFLAAFCAFVPAVYYIITSSAQSGFGQYLSLILSDSSYVLENWKQFTLSTISSLPIMSVIAILLSLFIVLSALRRTVRYSTYSKNVKQRMVSI